MVSLHRVSEKTALLETVEMKLPAGNSSRASSFSILSVLINFCLQLFASHNMKALHLSDYVICYCTVCHLATETKQYSDDREILVQVTNEHNFNTQQMYNVLLFIYAATTYCIQDT